MSLHRLAAGLRVLAPFVAFALLLPLVAGGVRTEVLGRSLSVSGLWAAWNIVAKATIGVTASVVLTTTTPAPEIIVGLDRLRVPRALTAIAGFMLRYREVLAGELRQMRIARVSRGYDPRWLWQARAVGTSAGALFLRSYERGERVHLAMLSRGFTGTMPPLRAGSADAADWAAALGAGPRGGGAGRRRVVGDVTDLVVDVHDVAFAYPDGRQALVGCNLQVRQGERVAVLGANGSGKTTLVLHLNGVLVPRPARWWSTGCRCRAPTCARSDVGWGSCSRIRTTSCSCRPWPGRRLRPGQPRPHGRRADGAGRGRARPRWA